MDKFRSVATGGDSHALSIYSNQSLKIKRLFLPKYLGNSFCTSKTSRFAVFAGNSRFHIADVLANTMLPLKFEPSYLNYIRCCPVLQTSKSSRKIVISGHGQSEIFYYKLNFLLKIESNFLVYYFTFI